VVIPQGAIDSVRLQLGRSRSSREAAIDPTWTRHLEAEIKNTHVTLTAILEERQLTLGEIASLKVGQLLSLEADLNSRVRLECSERPLFLCEIGQGEGAYTLRVDEIMETASGEPE
jgi:flagellar motor switch protein FliM